MNDNVQHSACDVLENVDIKRIFSSYHGKWIIFRYVFTAGGNVFYNQEGGNEIEDIIISAVIDIPTAEEGH